MIDAKTVQVRWAADTDKGVVILDHDIPAGTYTPEDASRLSSKLAEAAQKATDSHHVLAWLTEAGVDAEQGRAAVLALTAKADSAALMQALAPLLGRPSW